MKKIDKLNEMLDDTATLYWSEFEDASEITNQENTYFATIQGTDQGIINALEKNKWSVLEPASGLDECITFHQAVYRAEELAKADMIDRENR